MFVHRRLMDPIAPCVRPLLTSYFPFLLSLSCMLAGILQYPKGVIMMGPEVSYTAALGLLRRLGISLSLN